jgi:hypothetical protein
VTFESGSKLSRIENRVFSGCSCLSAICIPSDATRIGEDCFLAGESGSTLVFESGLKARSTGKD